MKEDVKEKWVAALRSGRFSQARSYLRVAQIGGSYNYCCLGVLCELYRQETGKGEWIISSFFAEGMASAVFLPAAVMTWSGLTDSDGGLVDLKGVREISLADLNDGNKEPLEPQNFATIADVIEQQL